MGKCIIFCSGEFKELIFPPTAADLVIAADGGLLHTEEIGLVPDVILGDFDSLGYIPENAMVSPVEKDDTDSMLAVKLGLERGFREFVIYGAMDGKRTDHTIANLQLLNYLTLQGARGWLVGRREIITVIRNDSVVFPPYCIEHLSVFCIGSDAHGVSIRGMRYEPENETLTAGFPLGISNRFIQKKATVSVEDGALLLVWKRKNGLH